MGLTNGEGSSSKIVTIVNGKFAIRLPDNSTDPEAVERTIEKGINAGKIRKELHYTGIEGKIQSCYADESEYGTQFITQIVDDEGSSYKLQMSLKELFKQYAKRMPNIDIDKPVFIGLGHDKDRNRPYLFVKQDGVNVPMAFTKEKPNGLPEPTKKTVKGKEVWDWDEQENFLYEVAIGFSSKMDKVEIPF